MKKKKLLSVLIALVMAFSLCLSLAACDKGNYSETFAGTLSTQSYESQENAAKAFLNTEIASTETRVSYKESSKEKDLTEEEVTAMNLTVESGTVEKVEKWQIGYSKTETNSRTAEDGSEEKLAYVTVYIVVIKIAPDGDTTREVYEYRYYVPLPEKGEALSRSYYDSVFDDGKYKNCTFTYTMKSTTKVMFIKQTMTVDYKMYLTEDAVMIDAKVVMPSASDEPSKSLTYYFVKDGSSVRGVKILNGVTSSASLYSEFGVSEISDLYSSQMDDAIYSFFVKTDYGFKMNEDKLQDLFDNALEVAGTGSGIDFGKSSAKYEFYVAEGKLDHALCEVKVQCKYDGITMPITVTQKYKYSDFGTTAVTVPDDVQSYLN